MRGIDGAMGYALPGTGACARAARAAAGDRRRAERAGADARPASPDSADRLRRGGGDRLCDPLPGGADRLLDAGFARIPRDYDDCARAAGAARLTELRGSTCRCCGRR